MTLPASGAISTADIRAEIGGSGAVVIPSDETRELTGVASGDIVLPDDFHGTTWGGAYFVSMSSSSVSGASSGPVVVSGPVTATPQNGVGPYTYAWTKTSGTTLTITASTSPTTSFSGTPGDGNIITAVYQCTVTDTGNSNATAVGFVNVSLRDTSTS